MRADEAEKKAILAGKAKLLMESEFFQAIAQSITQEAFARFTASALTEKEVRENAYLLVFAVDLLKNHLQLLINDGKIAERSTHKGND